MNYFVIAGKTEGFEYKDAKITPIEWYLDAPDKIESLRKEGYTIFYVCQIRKRIDDIINEVKLYG
jgi:hypothetical protein